MDKVDKVRIYELAKEMNTTSKRLIEKLAEINVNVKNHMSFLEDHELDSLYKHIGIVRKNGDEAPSEAPAKNTAPPATVKAEPKKEKKTDTKNAPRIIRKTEVFIDSSDEKKENSMPSVEQKGFSYRNEPKSNDRSNKRQDYVRTSTNNSGLRPGFVRDDKPDYKPTSDNRHADKKEFIKGDADNGDAVVQNSVEPKQVDSSNIVPEKSQEVATHSELVSDNETVKPNSENSHDDIKKPVTPNNNRPAYNNNRPNQQGDNRPTERKPWVDRNNNDGNNRPQGQGQGGGYQQRPQGQGQGGGYQQRPQGQGQGGGYQQRPQGQGQSGGYQQRPQGQGQGGGYQQRPQGQGQGGGYQQRPQGQGQGGGYQQRPQGQGGYQQGGGYQQRPQGQGGYQQRPQGQGQGGGYQQRPQGQGGYQQGGGYPQRSGGQRPGGGYQQRSVDIPRPEFTDAQKEELNSVRHEVRREFTNKDSDKDTKRDIKRDVSKTSIASKEKRVRPKAMILGEKKGVSEVLSEDFILNEFYNDDGVRNKKIKGKKEVKEKYIPPKAVLTSVKLNESVTVKDLAEALKKTSTEVIKKLMNYGLMVTLNNEIDFDTASIIADEYGVKAEKEVVVNEEDILFDEADELEEGNLESRAPVVVVMGHVDHGKTSLLDAVRETNVNENEAGGITQHIGAYMVKINNRNITFLDTPGHEAFTAMRARGAQVTDIAILVVAADDGVMPQTIEAINHAKAANLSIIVAINKIDKPGANPEKVKQELTEYGLVAEEWGGDTIFVPVSAKKRVNIDMLLEMVLLAADVLELKSDPNRQAKGTVIEAKLDKNKGTIATVLVQRGTLKVGDSVVTGTTVGRIRAMVDDKGQNVKEAGPSTPVEILGLPDVPTAGEVFYAITDEKVAKQLAEKRKLKLREQQLNTSSKVTLDDLFNQIKDGKVKDLNIIVKADLQGSVQAVKQSLEKLSNEEVRVKIIHEAVGAITESDVSLAQVSSAIIIGFNVRPGPNVADAAQNAGVDLRLYRVIYNAIEDVAAAMKGMLDPTFKEVVTGHIEVRQTFKVSSIGTVGGGYVTDGKVTRNSDIRVLRDNIVVHEGKLASLKRFKDDVKEVAQNYECGFSVEKYNDIKEGDVIEAFAMEEVVK